MERIDIEEFINDIEHRPAIWDTRRIEYSDRLKKKEAWEEICIKYVDQFKEKSIREKYEAITYLQRKWKGLRDCYNRECSKLKNIKSGSAASRRKQYMHYQQLSFLSSSGDVKSGNIQDEESLSPESSAVPSHSSVPVDYKKRSAARLEQDVYENMSENIIKRYATKLEQEIPENVTEHVKKKSTATIELELLESISENLKRRNLQDFDDPDRSFLLSLLPYLKTVPESCKLDVKAEMLYLLKKYKQYDADFSNVHQQFNGYYSAPQSDDIPLSQSVSGASYLCNTLQNNGINISIPNPSPMTGEFMSSNESDGNSTHHNLPEIKCEKRLLLPEQHCTVTKKKRRKIRAKERLRNEKKKEQCHSVIKNQNENNTSEFKNFSSTLIDDLFDCNLIGIKKEVANES